MTHVGQNHYTSPPSRLENTIISLVLQQALLKLTSHTAYPTVLAYCLERTEQLLDIKFIILDHKYIQKNLSTTVSPTHALDSILTDDVLSRAYFYCSLDQFKQICGSTADTSTNAIDITTVISVLISKGWLVRRIDQVLANQDMAAYRLNVKQLQRDLQAIGYDLIVIKQSPTADLVSTNTDQADHHSTNPEVYTSAHFEAESDNEFQSRRRGNINNTPGDDAL